MLQRFLIFAHVSILLLAGTPVKAVDTENSLQTTGDVRNTNAFIINPGARFRDCENCPEMVVIPPGRFQMGSPADERGRSSDEGPLHEVTLQRPFAIGRFEVTISEWNACVEAGACRDVPDDRRGGGNNRPVTNISWNDTQQYVAWLSALTGEQYRLPSESEWEYAARAGSGTARYWAERSIACAFANVYDISGQRVHQFEWPHFTCIDASTTTAPVGNYLANDFGLHDTLGNVWEWVQDCWVDSYDNAPDDGSPRLDGDCRRRVVRGGSWKNITWATRSAFRGWQGVDDRVDANGLRVARFSE